jgi:hypothetical protein
VGRGLGSVQKDVLDMLRIQDKPGAPVYSDLLLFDLCGVGSPQTVSHAEDVAWRRAVRSLVRRGLVGAETVREGRSFVQVIWLRPSRVKAKKGTKRGKRPAARRA